MEEYLLNLLVCPKTGGKLVYSNKTDELICKESMLAYPIKNKIPVMLIDSARKIHESEL